MSCGSLPAKFGIASCPKRQRLDFGGVPVGCPALAVPRNTRMAPDAVRATTLEETSSDSKWFTQSDSFLSVREPSQRAQQLENSFWHHPIMEVPATRDEAMVLMERLQHETTVLGSSSHLNVVAFTGGSGPALTAYLLNSVFDGSVVACIGPPASMEMQQVEHANYVAELLGLDLLEVDSGLWQQLQIPHAISTDANEVCETLASLPCEGAGLVIFSGATADDLANSEKFLQLRNIKAPLAGVSRATVNALSKAIGLPSWSQKLH